MSGQLSKADMWNVSISFTAKGDPAANTPLQVKNKSEEVKIPNPM